MIQVYLRETEEPLSQAAHSLLCQVLEREYGISRPELLRGPYGKPYLKEGPCFNLSHTHGAVAAAVSERPVGIDLERVRPYLSKLPERVLSPVELRWFRSGGERKTDFFTLWTLKESFLKLQGTGLTGFPNETEFYFEDRWRLRNSGLYFSVFCEKDLLLSVCGEEQSEIRLHWC